MSSINMSIRTDSELKAKAEAVLSQLGLTMNGTINMFLSQIVREQAVPLNLSLRKTDQEVRTELLMAQIERAIGYRGRTLDSFVADMDSILAEAEQADHEE